MLGKRVVGEERRGKQRGQDSTSLATDSLLGWNPGAQMRYTAGSWRDDAGAQSFDCRNILGKEHWLLNTLHWLHLSFAPSQEVS